MPSQQTFNNSSSRNVTVSWRLPQRLIQQNKLGNHNVTSFLQLQLNFFLQPSTNTSIIDRSPSKSFQTLSAAVGWASGLQSIPAVSWTYQNTANMTGATCKSHGHLLDFLITTTSFIISCCYETKNGLTIVNWLTHVVLQLLLITKIVQTIVHKINTGH